MPFKHLLTLIINEGISQESNKRMLSSQHILILVTLTAYPIQVTVHSLVQEVFEISLSQSWKTIPFVSDQN